MSNALEEVRNRARMVLKALKGEGDGEGEKKETPAAVPEAPADPDRLDPRVEDASPTEDDLDQAKEDAKPGEEGEEDPEFEDLNGEDGEEDEDGFNEFGHKDMDPREVSKAFPQIGHLFPDETYEELDDNETTPGADPKILGELMAALKGMGEVIGKINGELERLKKGATIQGRELKKALEANASLEDRLNKIHETAPAAGAPRAITKAMGGAQSETPGFSTADLTALAASQKLSSLEIAQLCQSGQRGV